MSPMPKRLRVAASAKNAVEIAEIKKPPALRKFVVSPRRMYSLTKVAGVVLSQSIEPRSAQWAAATSAVQT
jgi:hypothetical protein